MRGFWLARLLRTADPALIARLVGEIVAKAASGQLSLPIAQSFDLDQAGEAAAASNVAGRDGKVALTA